jgi:Tfp pilus assembly protein PilF
MEGNHAVKNSDWHKANYMYQKAQLYLIYTIAEGEHEDRLYRELEISVNLNLAFVLLKLEKFRDAMNHCHQVLKLEPSNLKAKYRMSKAHLEVNEFEDAQIIISEVLQNAPTNKEFLEL